MAKVRPECGVAQASVAVRFLRGLTAAYACGSQSSSGATSSILALQRALAFVVVCSTYLFWLINFGDKAFWYDAGAYWGSVKTYSLNDYGLSYRGYSFPYLCFLLRQFAAWLHLEPLLAFWVASSMLMATLGTVVVPSAVKATVPGCKWGFLKLLAFNALIFVFFRGYAKYPLSDVPAVTALLAAVWLTKTSPLGVLPGVLLGLVINIRPVYLVSAIPIGLLAAQRAMVFWRNDRKSAAFRYCGAFFIGMCLVLGPQVYINHHNFHRRALLPPTDLVYGQSLYLYQLQLGIGAQKLEGNVGVEYPDAQVQSNDLTGRSIAASQNAATYRDLVRLYAKYPAEFTAIYTRHLFNGLDVRFPTVYIKHPYAKRWWYSILNYTIIFLFISACRNVSKLRVNRVAFGAAIAATMLPVIASIPTRVEVRYFLPLHILMYVVVTATGASELRPRAWSWAKALLYCAFLVVCCTLSDNAYACLAFPYTKY